MSQQPSPIPQVGVRPGRGPSAALSTFFSLRSPFPGCVRPQGAVGRRPRDWDRVADAHTGRGDGEPPPLRSESWKGWEGEGSWAPGQAILETKRSWREGHGQGHLELLRSGLLSTLDCLGKGSGRKGLAGLAKPFPSNPPPPSASSHPLSMALDFQKLQPAQLCPVPPGPSWGCWLEQLRSEGHGEWGGGHSVWLSCTGAHVH